MRYSNGEVISKSEDAVYVPTKKTTGCDQHTTTLIALQDLRDIAWKHAMKYRWDPILGGAHEEYLNMLNGILKECGI